MEKTSTQAENSDLVPLNTEGACFLCLQQKGLSLPVSTSKMTTETTEVWLRSINRYLKLDIPSILRRSLEPGQIDELPKNCDFAVEMCDDCAEVAVLLAEIASGLELFIMMTDYRLQQFHGALEKSEGSGMVDRWTEVKTRMLASSSGSVSEVKMVENLRQAIKTRCAEKLRKASKTRYPKVCLERLNVNSGEKMRKAEPVEVMAEPVEAMAEPSSEDRTTETLECEPDVTTILDCLGETNQITESRYPKLCLERVNPESTRKYQDVVRPDDKTGSTEDADQSTLSMETMDFIPLNDHTTYQIPQTSPNSSITEICIKYFEKLPSENRFRCLECNKNISSRGNPYNHIFTRHPEIVFATLKLPSLTNEEFHSCCKHVLKTKALAANPINALPKCGTNLPLECPLCRLKCSHAQHLRYHMIVEHKPDLEKEIDRLQRSESFKNIASDILESTSENSGAAPEFVISTCKKYYAYNHAGNQFNCLVCKKDFSGTNARIHLVDYHLDKLFENCRIKGLTNKQFSMRCKQVLTNEASKAKAVVKVTGKTLRVIECHLCKKKLGHLGHLRCHLFMNHYTILEKEIVKLQKTENVNKSSKKVKNVMVSKENPKQILNEFERKQFQRLPGNQMKCLLCESRVACVSLKAHILTNHPDKCFPNLKMKSVTDLQFEDFCKQLIENEIKQVKLSKSQSQSKGWGCSFCKLKFRNIPHCLSHLFLTHYRALKGKLLQQQQKQQILRKKPSSTTITEDKKLEESSKSRNYARGNSFTPNFTKFCNALFTPTQINNQLHCVDCNCVVNSAISHTITHHPEKIFATKRLEGKTQEKFSQCCKQVLQALQNKAIQHGPKTGILRGLYKCPFCQLQSKQPQNFKYHLITKHYKKLEEEILKVDVCGINC